MSGTVAAVIVIFHPRLNLLAQLLESLRGQVDDIYIVDNTPQPEVTEEQMAKLHPGKLSYIPLYDNTGIAVAQNVGIRRALQSGYSHVLLLDDDSILPPNMVERLLAAEARLLEAGHRVAAVGPFFVEQKTGAVSTAHRNVGIYLKKIKVDQSSQIPAETDFLIGSGSLIRASVLADVGLLREELFMEYADIDWCLRARSLGFRAYLVPGVLMSHSLGDETAVVFGKHIPVHKTPLRNYCTVRNATYLCGLRTTGWRWRVFNATRIPQFILLLWWFSPRRISDLMLLLRAFLDGCRGKMGPYHAG